LPFYLLLEDFLFICPWCSGRVLQEPRLEYWFLFVRCSHASAPTSPLPTCRFTPLSARRSFPASSREKLKRTDSLSVEFAVIREYCPPFRSERVHLPTHAPMGALVTTPPACLLYLLFAPPSSLPKTPPSSLKLPMTRCFSLSFVSFFFSQHASITCLMILSFCWGPKRRPEILPSRSQLFFCSAGPHPFFLGPCFFSRCGPPLDPSAEIAVANTAPPLGLCDLRGRGPFFFLPLLRIFDEIAVPYSFVSLILPLLGDSILFFQGFPTSPALFPENIDSFFRFGVTAFF